jgi:geranylgeranyl diphosphate synthase type I
MLQENVRSGLVAIADERARIASDLLVGIEAAVGDTPGRLGETTAHVLSTPGKLLRPLLMLDACRAAGGDPDRAFPAAVGTEYGHVASLIHDDIIDGDDERRAQQTLHVKYDLGAAILTGDLLIFQTFLSYTQCRERGASSDDVLAAIRTLSETCIDMCRGQELEAAIAGDLDTDERTYLEMIRLKTAGVCSAAARIGALLGGAGEEAIRAVGEYGANLGMAFQIVDDLLAYEGEAPAVGKPLHSDMLNRRVTLPIIYACRAGGPEVRERIGALLGHRQTPEEAYGELVAILTCTHALRQARARAFRYTTTAKEHLDLLPPSESRERLHTLADLLLSRSL